MVRVEYIESDCRLVASVYCKNISSSDGINDVFDELDIALTKLQEKIGEERHYFFLIDIVVKGAPRALAEFSPYEPGDAFLGSHNCWQAFCPPFWRNASANPQSRRRIIEWIGRLEETLRLAESRSLSTDSLWEHDETQFGEPLLTNLSLSDVQFVPLYTRLLRLWDLSHAVHQGEAVTEIVNRHGITPETKELILCYDEVTGGFDDLGLLDLVNDKQTH
jgi:hypothetical protein